jgi:hypothetical protein
MKIVSKITSGDSTSWIDDASTDNIGNTVSSADYTLTYELRGPGSLTLTGVANGTGWKTDITTTQSGNLKPGTYYWQAFATKVNTRVMLGSGSIVVEPNLAVAVAGFDGRSQSEKDLAAVQNAIRVMISGGAVAEYSIGGRSLRKISLTDLLALESSLKASVFREQKKNAIENNLGNPSNVYVRFK